MSNIQEELIELLKNSPCIETEEVQMWIDILPTMEKIHFERLKDILLEEKEKLGNLHKKK